MAKISPESLIINNYYVNINNGLCIYRGQRVNNEEINYVFEYANSETLWLGEEWLKNIREYSNGPAATNKKLRLNKLNDNTTWVKTKFAEQQRAAEQAQQLMALYIQRSNVNTYTFPNDTETQQQFESAFQYEPTADQLLAVRDIKNDLESNKIMNRIVIGDVGSGKSEIYARACFKLIDNNKQVAILLPSSVLANQAYLDLVERFSRFPHINIVLFSRENSPKQKREILSRVSTGEANIIVGTTAICSPKVVYKDLALLIVDECHKMGIVDKTKLLQYENSLNVLYLSATPLPAEIFKTLAGVYDISKLNTMPSSRKNIITKISEDSDEIIKLAIDREIERQGQCFIVYNNVEKLELTKYRLLQINSTLKIGIVHGQMPQKDAQGIMAKFKDYKLDILLATTIIECGINVTNSNTIIIISSQNYGLAQLHQLRGRVGRSDKQGYCILLYDKNKTLEAKAIQRLTTMQKNSTLGSGFIIAEKDREMRGDGDFLLKQSGKLSSLGYSLYREILEKAIQYQKEKIDNNLENI